MIELTSIELLTAAGTDLGWSEWLPIHQDRLDLFRMSIGAYGSPDTLVTDIDVSNHLAVSLIALMNKQILVIRDKDRGTNYGMDNARFIQPLRAGDVAGLTGRIVDAHVRADSGVQYRLDLSLWARGADQPALACEVTHIVYPVLPA